VEPAQLDFERLLDRFDEAWRTGAPLQIEELLDSARGTGGTSSRRKLLEELLKVDLEYRWRRAASAQNGSTSAFSPLRLEEYVQRYPDLGKLEELSAELIGEEYRVRQCWGDHPAHTDYTARFAQQATKLEGILTGIDIELAADAARQKRLSLDQDAQTIKSLNSGLARADAFSASGGRQSITSITALMDAIRRCQLLSATQLDEIDQDLRHIADVESFAQELVQRGCLTQYQVNELLRGRGADLLLGPYVVLERLGEGGVGQVFKARQQPLGRVVALKVVRRELLSDPEVLGRFWREIRVISQLTHPNIVRAYDAGPVGATHFLAMEYVEGIDLARLVKQSGPLPVAAACEYVRQADLGLQHAHERGLVHRDIKPSNLMLSAAGHRLSAVGQAEKPNAERRTPKAVVKILDLGLARFRQTVDGEATAMLTAAIGPSSLTPVQALMIGTPDYMAPEQAVNFHGADIRADIYSLGCTLYYLLAGQPPFPGGALAEKLLRHQQAEAPPLELFRADVPGELSAIARRMLAKRAEDRYQVPGEVAAALQRLLGDGKVVFAAVPQLKVYSPAVNAADCWQTARSADLAPRLTSRLRRLRIAVIGGVLSLALFAVLVALSPPSSWFSKAPSNLALPVAQREFRDAPELLPAPAEQKEPLLPFDQLDPEAIPGALRFPGQPNELVAMLDGQPGQPFKQVHSVAISPDGKTLAIAPEKGVQLWSIAPLRERVLLPHGNGVTTMLFAPDGKTVITCDGSAHVWDLSGKRLTTIRKVGTVALAPDGKMLATAHNDPARSEYTVRLWELVPGAEPKPLPHEFKGHTNYVLSLAFSPDGALLATGGRDAMVRMWSVQTGEERPMLKGHTYYVTALAFSPDGKTLASGSHDNTVRRWDVARGKEHTLERRYHERGVNALAYAANGKMASADQRGCVVLWDEDHKQKLVWQSARDVTSLAFSPEGQHLAIGNANGTVCILRLAAPPVKAGP
jgi:serine/threonine-protein kinase